MKIVLVYPDTIGRGKDWYGLYNHGIGSLSAVLKREGHVVSLLHIINPLNRREFFDFLQRQMPDVIGFSVTSNLFDYVKRLSRWVKEYSSATVICGGIHPTLMPEEVIAEVSIDAICVGEGEYSLLDFLRYMGKETDNKYIQGIWFKENGGLYKGGSRPLANLDDLPFPDKSLFHYQELTYGRESSGIFMASKGCPYACTYCSNEAVKKQANTSQQPYVRFKSVDYIIAEVEDELTKYPFVKIIGFDDDILPLKLDWFEEFVKKYKKHIHLPMVCNLRPNLATRERFKLLKEAGCIQLSMGIEAGNDFIRNKILKRNLSKEQIVGAYRLCKEAGIKMFSYNMVGLPFENISMMLETVKINAQVKTDMCQASIFYPYPKTELYDLCQRENLITERYGKFNNFFTNTSLDFTFIKRTQIRFVQKFFSVLVLGYRILYSLPWKMSNLGGALFDALLSSRGTALFIYPVLLSAYQGMMSTKITNRVGRWILRNIIENTNKPVKQKPSKQENI